MKTNAEFVSRIAGDLKALTKDGRINRRLILSIGEDKARAWMSQKLDEMTLFKEDEIISHIPCFEMEEIPPVSCGDVFLKGCKSVMRSVKELPESISGKNGTGILDVSTINYLDLDSSKSFTYITTRKFRDVQRLKHVITDNNYYTILNNRLVLLESEYEAVSLQMFVLKGYQIAGLSSCSSEEDRCKSYWDYPFVCPGKLYDSVVKDTLTEIANIYRTSIEDSNPNLDVNIKGRAQA